MKQGGNPQENEITPLEDDELAVLFKRRIEVSSEIWFERLC